MDKRLIGTGKYARDGRMLEISDGLLKHLGYIRGEGTGETGADLGELIAPEDRERVVREREAQLRHDGSFSVDYRLMSRDGQPVHVREWGRLDAKEGGRVVLSEFYDPSRFFAAEEFYRDALDALPLPVFVIEADETVSYLNRAACAVYGCSPEECVGRPAARVRARGGVSLAELCGRSGADELEEIGDQVFRMCSAELITPFAEDSGRVCVAVDVTEWDDALQELRETEERYRIAFGQTTDVVWVYSFETGTSMRPDPHATDAHGIADTDGNTPEENVAMGFIHPDGADAYLAMYAGVRQGKEHNHCVVQMKDLSGSYRWVQIDYTTVFDNGGRPVKAIGLSHEVTKERNAQMRYIQEKKYRESIVSDAIFAYEIDVTNNRLVDGNKQWLQSLEIECSDSFDHLIQTAASRVPEQYQHILLDALNRDALLRAFAEEKYEVSCEYPRVTPDDRLVWVCTTVNLIQEPTKGDICGFIYIKDINEQKHKELALKKRAEHDPLTGLFNRDAAKTRIDEALARGGGNTGALLMIDLDDFKLINDTFGHAFGDAVLSELANKLRRAVREEDIVARIGGDEMMIFLRNPKGRRAVCQKADSICRALNTAFSSGDARCVLSGSVGIAFAPQDGDNLAELYHKADVALYNAKRRGKGRCVTFEDSLSLEAMEETHRRTEIEKGFEKSFSENITAYIFKILFETSDLDISVVSVLELLSRHYNAHHGYLFVHDDQNNTQSMYYEWCDKDVAPQKEWMQNLNSSEMLDFHTKFDKDGIYSVSDISQAPPKMRTFLERIGAKSVIQCSLGKKGVKGYIGVDDFKNNRVFTDEERRDIQFSAQIIGTFLSEKRSEQQRERYIQSLRAVLDSTQSYIYVVERETNTLHFINEQTRGRYPDAEVGQLCYRVLFGRSAPCANCMLWELGSDLSDRVSKEIYLARIERWIEATAVWVDWPDGRRYCLVNCVDITKYKK